MKRGWNYPAGPMQGRALEYAMRHGAFGDPHCATGNDALAAVVASLARSREQLEELASWATEEKEMLLALSCVRFRNEWYPAPPPIPPTPSAPPMPPEHVHAPAPPAAASARQSAASAANASAATAAAAAAAAPPRSNYRMSDPGSFAADAANADAPSRLISRSSSPATAAVAATNAAPTAAPTAAAAASAPGGGTPYDLSATCKVCLVGRCRLTLGFLSRPHACFQALSALETKEL